MFQINITIVGYLSVMTVILCHERHLFSYVCYALACMSFLSTVKKVTRLIRYCSYFSEFVPGDGDSPIRSSDPRQHRGAEGGEGTDDWPNIGGGEESLEEGDAPCGDVLPGVEAILGVPSKEVALWIWSYTLGALVQIITLGLLVIGLSVMFGLYSRDWKCANNDVPNQLRHHGYGYGVPDQQWRLGYGFATT